jgi:hypothetical protein
MYCIIDWRTEENIRSYGVCLESLWLQMKIAAKWIKFIAGLVAFVALKAVYIVMEWAPLVLVILAICALGKYLIG